MHAEWDEGGRLDIRCGGILWTRGKVNHAQAQQQKAATGEIEGL